MGCGRALQWTKPDDAVRSFATISTHQKLQALPSLNEKVSTTARPPCGPGFPSVSVPQVICVFVEQYEVDGQMVGPENSTAHEMFMNVSEDHRGKFAFAYVGASAGGAGRLSGMAWSTRPVVTCLLGLFGARHRYTFDAAVAAKTPLQ